MAAAAEKFCSLCESEIGKRSYRQINKSETFLKYMQELHLSTSGYICNTCVVKLNRLEKIDFDIENKVEKLRRARIELIELLNNISKKRTPTKGKKRVLRRETPTPRIVKKFASGDRPSTSATPSASRKKLAFADRDSLCSVDASTQTRLQTMMPKKFNFKLVVSLGPDKERSHIINDPNEEQICKSIFYGKGPATLVNCLKDKKYEKPILNKVCQKLRSEICILSRKDETFMKASMLSCDDFSWDRIWKKLSVSAPFLQTVFETVVTKDVKEKDISPKLPVLGTSLAVLLHGRNPFLSQVQYMNGLILDNCGVTKECLTLMNHMGIAASQPCVWRKKKAIEKEHQLQLEKLMNESSDATADTQKDGQPVRSSHVPPFEVIGDNIDILVNPGTMTQERQRKSWHWFLLVVANKRITNSRLPSDKPSADIAIQPATAWIPSEEEVSLLHEHQQFHVAKILVKYISELSSIKLPHFIEHKHLEDTSKASDFHIADLIDESENTSEGMVKILQEVHQVAVAEGDGSLRGQVVFGGDVLTNERAFSAQEAVQNGTTELDALKGVIHRPEGLHHEMNFLMAIYKLFYTEKSGPDKGSMYQLRNLINRRDVTGSKEVHQSFRAHFKFMEDIVAATVIGEFLEHHSMETADAKPQGLPVLSLMSQAEQTKWVMDKAKDIMMKLEITDTQHLDNLRQSMESLDKDDQTLMTMFKDNKFTCALCGKNYTRQAWFKTHLSKGHSWIFTEISSTPASHDNPLSCFMRMSLLLLDTFDAYRMGDGDRILGNAKFEWLYAGRMNHTKYRLWLWRMLAYDMAVLSPRESYEYRWNTTVSTAGGVGKNIPNDNLVEIQVHKIKSQLQTQGANKSYQSARTTAMTIEYTDSLKQSAMRASKLVKQSRKKPQIDKSKDILSMAAILNHHAGEKWRAFSKFSDPLSKINGEKLHEWVRNQRVVAKLQMQK